MTRVAADDSGFLILIQALDGSDLLTGRPRIIALAQHHSK
jgi:hypothetical protein